MIGGGDRSGYCWSGSSAPSIYLPGRSVEELAAPTGAGPEL